MPKAIKILSVKSPDYKRHHVTGLWGGISPDGQKLSIELFEDAPAMVDEVTILAHDDGRIIEQEAKALEYTIHRHINAGITIPLSELPVFIEWMKDKYEEYTSRISKNESDKNN
jgi:hypothetical protein